MYYIYILECKDGSLYTGFTNNIEDRVKTHNAGKGAKYTRGRTPVVLKYSEEFEDKSSALKREAQIKKLTKDKKLQLINSK